MDSILIYFGIPGVGCIRTDLNNVAGDLLIYAIRAFRDYIVHIHTYESEWNGMYWQIIHD